MGLFSKKCRDQAELFRTGLASGQREIGLNETARKRKGRIQCLSRHMMSISSRNHTIEIDAKAIIKKAKEEGILEGKIEGKEEEQNNTIAKLHGKGKSAAEISELLDLPLEKVKVVKPKASRGDSAEVFLFCSNFKKLE